MTELQQIAKAINSAQSIAIMGHRGGDADCYGSALGLATALSGLGKDVRVVSGEEYPDSLSFLFFYYSGEIVQSTGAVDLLILLDTSDLQKLSAPVLVQQLQAGGTRLIQIDHHTKGDLPDICDHSYINAGASSASELVFDLITELGVAVDKDIATCLLTGIMGDTSSFQNQNTNRESFDISSQLMKSGARQRVIANYLFGNKEVDSLKIWGLAMERLSFDKNYGVVITYLLHDEIKKSGLSLDILSGITNYLNSIKGARVVMLVAEEERGTIKVSMRTRDEYANVANIAKQLGGGGHVKAAGFSFPGSLKILTEGRNSHIVIV